MTHAPKLCLGTVQFGLPYGITNQSGQVTELEVSRLKKEHGTLGSYDWCCENWGTKWNSVHHVETGNDDYDDELYVWFGFNTAWSPPTPIAHFLKYKFEGIKFRWFYRDETDMFCGYLDDDIGGF